MVNKASIVSLALLFAVGCSSTPEMKEPPAPAETPPPQEMTIWQFPAELSVTLRPDRGESLSVTDGEILVTLNVPTASVETEQSLTVRLVEQDAGRLLVFDPPLALLRYANIIVTTRNADAAFFPIARSGGQYRPVRYEVQDTTTSVWTRSADAIWMGDKTAAQQIAANMVVPAGIDCETVLSLDDLGLVMGLINMQQDLGYDAAAPDAYAGIARRAAAELNRILGEDIPEDACGYYFASLLELGRIVGTIGLVEASFNVAQYKARVETLLARCPLNYLLHWDGEGRFPDGRMVFWSRDYNRGTLGTTHLTPHLLDMRRIWEGESFTMTLDAEIRMKTEFDLADPLNPKAVLTISAIEGKLKIPVPEGESIELDFDYDEGDFAFSMGVVGSETFVAAAGVAGKQVDGVVAIAGIGVLEVHAPTDAEVIESYAFELRRESTITIHNADSEGVSTMTGTLLIPALQDVDFHTKLLCEGLLTPP